MKHLSERESLRNWYADMVSALDEGTSDSQIEHLIDELSHITGCSLGRAHFTVGRILAVDKMRKSKEAFTGISGDGSWYEAYLISRSPRSDL